MDGKARRNNASSTRLISLVAGTLLVMLLAVGAGSPSRSIAADSKSAPSPPIPQQFQDVPDSNAFATFVNALFIDKIISGYPCGGAGEPCIPPGNLPYYRPNNNITRAQMAKFVENGRRSIDKAIGEQLVMTDSVGVALVISSTVDDSISVKNATGGEGLTSYCTRAGQNCWAVYGFGQTGDRPGYFEGGKGTYMDSDDDGAYSLNVQGGAYRAADVQANKSTWYSLYVDRSADANVHDNVAGFNGSVHILGDLVVDGSKTGYVVDLMQNAGPDALQPGDVVVIAGSAPAVLGDIPVVTVKKAARAYDTGVAGVVDQIMYVPSAEVRAAYATQEQARSEVMDRQAAAEQAAQANGTKADLAAIPVPEARISDQDGNVHPDQAATEAATNAYVNVVTLGSYKAVKVDASFGLIHVGDLLTSSPNPGYAMKADGTKTPLGSVIGKALAALDSGTSTIPVLITLK